MIFITAIISLGIGLALGGFFWGHYADSEERQAEEIAALQEENARVRSRASDLATQLFEARESRDRMAHLEEIAVGMLRGEMNEHVITKRKLSAAKGQITKLRRRV